MKYLNKSNFIGPAALCRSLATDLKANGFTLVAVDGAESDEIAETSTSFYFKATEAVDTQIESQPWGLILKASDVEKKLELFVLPQIQVNGSFEAVKRSATETVGSLAPSGLTSGAFASMADWGMIAEAALEAFPLAYDLVITDHGFAFSMNAEGFDNTGKAHSWCVVQRGQTEGETAVGEKSPLFAIYSCAGGQKGDPDQLIPASVQRFTVIEKGVSAATASISAVVPTPDGFPIINPLQQVMIAADNTAIVLFPQIINTHRYVYFTTLDMLGYTSADVISAASEVELTPVTKKTTYRGMNANGRDNRGLRVMFPIKEA